MIDNPLLVDNTFWSDFTIADAFGVNAIKDTYKRAFEEWNDDYKMLTALVITLNHKIWQHHKSGHTEYARLYNKLWTDADNYAYSHLTDDALSYFLEVTD